jgi:hypothetical protein
MATHGRALICPSLTPEPCDVSETGVGRLVGSAGRW